MSPLRGTLLAGLLFAGALSTTSASASGHCKGTTTGPPSFAQGKTGLAITTGYRGLGGIGTLDSTGCLNGQEVHDTRYALPRADMAALLFTAPCKPGAKLVAKTSLNGLGIKNVAPPMACIADRHGRTVYLSDFYTIDPALTGKITGSVVLDKKTSFQAETRTVV